VEERSDFFMRSLRQDIEAVANTLSELQKVGDELAANPGYRGGGVTRDLHSFEVFVKLK
jgi:hypothetical protein